MKSAIQSSGSISFSNYYDPKENFEVKVASFADSKYWEIGSSNVYKVETFDDLDDAKLYHEII